MYLMNVQRRPILLNKTESFGMEVIFVKWHLCVITLLEIVLYIFHR